MASYLIEKAGHGGREKRNALGGSISRPDGRRGHTFEVNPAFFKGTAVEKQAADVLQNGAAHVRR